MAVEIIYDRYGPAIFAAAYRLTADRGIAEEVVQETFLTLWNRAETFDATAGSLAAWLHTIARHRAIDRLRAAGRRPTLVALTSSGTSEEDPAQALERLIASGATVAGAGAPASPEAAFEAADLQEALRSAISDLPDAERTAILLAYQEDLSQSEIADRMGWPLGTVKTRTRRALLRLRGALGPAFGPTATHDDVPVSAGEDR
ncbi:MAG: sigma-70 family RNA polymerase sigma factor [Chloroflexi bacterium]|nr:sigma-70 family RNA polymerase sigma factor [Chloroflexota bacterium]